MAVFLVEVPAGVGGRANVNDVTLLLIEADSAAIARTMAAAQNAGDSGWSDAVATDITTLSADDFEGFRYEVVIGGDPTVDGSPDMISASYTGVDSDTVDLVGAGLAAALLAAWRSDPKAVIQDDGGVFTDFTAEASEATEDDVELYPAVPASGDAVYFGASAVFNRLSVDVDTAGEGTYTVAWEYWDGDTWETLSVTDGTDSFKNAGVTDVTFTPPVDWAASTINSQGPFFYIRAVIDAGTTTTVPLAGRAWTALGTSSYSSGDNTLTAAALADGFGDHTLSVKAFPPGGAEPVASLISTIVDGGVAAAVLTVVLAGPTAIPKVLARK